MLVIRRILMPTLDRITFDPNVMSGRACIRGMRMTVALILNLVTNGMSSAEIIEAYPYLEAGDIQQALRYVAWLAEESVYDLAGPPSPPEGGILTIAPPSGGVGGPRRAAL
jgi:uncharacterized protein (DUF433 family)